MENKRASFIPTKKSGKETNTPTEKAQNENKKKNEWNFCSKAFLRLDLASGLFIHFSSVFSSDI